MMDYFWWKDMLADGGSDSYDGWRTEVPICPFADAMCRMPLPLLESTAAVRISSSVIRMVFASWVSVVRRSSKSPARAE